MSDSAKTLQASLNQAIAFYQAALSTVEFLVSESATVESADLQAFTKDVLALLAARDRVERQRQASEAQGITESTYTLLDLDERLRKLGGAIATHVPLESYRQSLNPPESSWWWFLKPPIKPHKWDRFDWLFNTLTVICLAISASFFTYTVKAFSAQGFDLQGTLSLIIQGTGLAAVTGGVLTDKGKRFVENGLRSINVPPHFHAEMICLASGGLLLLTSGIYASLPKIGDHYYSRAERNRENGNLVVALSLYQRALQLKPGDSKLYVGMGRVAEAQGNLQAAEGYYKNGNTPEARSGLGRVLILQSLEEGGWTAKLDEKVARRADVLLYNARGEIREQLRSRNSSMNIPHTHAVLVELYTTYGILNFVGFEMQLVEDMDQDEKEVALEKLKSAEYYFQCATTSNPEKCNPEIPISQEIMLPAVKIQLDTAQCYLRIVEQIRQFISYQEGQDTQPLKDVYDEADNCYQNLPTHLYNDTIMFERKSFSMFK
jgi:tetratricopeptide (TPR) repeat protein